MNNYNSRLIIKHFGAVKDVNIAINKINVIIGSQGSGKSTIAKVLSFCQWAEKRYMIEGKFNYTIEDMLQNFHRIDGAYFTKETYVEYESQSVRISFNSDKKIKIEPKDKSSYYKSKNLYIPAERNFATTIPNLGRYNETSDNIMNLLYDWNDAKKQYIKAKGILNLGFSFSYNEKEEEDYIHFSTEKGEKRKMPLRFASSGLQSITPLIILFDYLTDVFYKKEKPLSPFEKKSIDKYLREIHNKINAVGVDNIAVSEIDRTEIKKLLEEFANLKEIYTNNNLQLKPGFANNISSYHFSRFIIEEPEQNLYPQTQKDLIYYLLKVLKNSERDHQLTITTHSPFILYSLNNCMMGYLIKDKMPKKEQAELFSRSSWINPELVSVWQLENGALTSIKEEDTRVIGAHSFDKIMQGVMGESFEMLGYFE